MSLFKRGWFSVIKKPKKNILLGAILYSISLLLLFAVGIRGQQRLVQQEIISQIDGSFHLELNDQSGTPQYAANGEVIRNEVILIPDLMAEVWISDQFATIAASDIQKIFSVEGITSFNVVSQMIRLEPLNFQNDQSLVTPGSRHNPQNDKVMVTGTLDMQELGDVINNFISLKEGRWIEPTDYRSDSIPLVISEDIAEKNKLLLGDILDFGWEDTESEEALDYFDFEREDDRKISGEIVGIFTVERSLNPSWNDSSLENAIFSKLDFWEELLGDTRYGAYAYHLATFSVENISEYEAVKEKILNLNINWDRYNLIDMNDMFENLSSSFNGIEQLSKIMFMVAIATGFAMLWLVFVLWVRNRNHEIAIFLAVGIEKSKVIIQFIYEALLVAIVSFVLAVVSLPVANQFIDIGSLVAEFQHEEPIIVEIDGELFEIDPTMIESAGGESQESVMNEEFFKMATKSVTIAAKSVIGVMASIVGLVGFSIIMSMIPVLKMKPKDIFTKMS